jgi:enoyl-CoA hydratase/carnithine racemase
MSNIAVHRDGDLLTLIFSRPEAANAFCLDDALHLQKILRTHKSARIVIWRARGSRCFCAGGDLAAYARMSKREQGIAANRKIAAALAELAKFPAVTLAIVEGDCWGGGVELLSAFDSVWAVPHAAFGLWQRRIGLTFGWGGGARLAGRIGKARLIQTALYAQAMTAMRAADLGLVDRIIGADDVERELRRWLKQQGQLPYEPVAALKAMTAKNEASWFRRLWWSPSHKRVLARFKSRGSRE